jgi:hypothetical protein
MLRTTALGLACSVAFGVSLASAGGNHPGGGGGSGMGGGAAHSAGGGGAPSMAGGAAHAVGGGGGPSMGNAGRVSTMSMRSDSSPGRMVDHDMGHTRTAEMHDHDRDHHDHDRDFGRDHDHDRDRDHDRFRFFPAFAYDTYSTVYDPGYTDCWDYQKALIHGHWRVHRIWVCN